MAATALESAPVLSTPDTHIFEDPTPTVDVSSLPRLSDEQVALTYEIERTVREIREGRWKRIALQFPDHMLVDAPRVYEQLNKALEKARNSSNGIQTPSVLQNGNVADELASGIQAASLQEKEEVERLFILGDTSYGACCVDEVAAEHVDADVVVHYGRSCLSPPSRLPVIYVFTERPLDLDAVITTFQETYPDKDQKIILMADIPYSHHIPTLHARLQSSGYTHIYPTEIIHNPSSLLPNRTTPPEVADSKEALRPYHLFHISTPPTSLLLTLSSRLSAIHIYPTDTPSPSALPASTAMTLRRRYAIITSLSSAPIFGILINTLSVKNYLHILSHVQSLIAAAGKKSYTFVVGKVNAAKVANFSEVAGWVVIGCWESSLMESKEFWKPIITPFELEMVLMGDEERVWTGEWEADFQKVLEGKERTVAGKDEPGEKKDKVEGRVQDEDGNEANDAGDYDSEEESAPPEFDLRTGRYVSHSRPMRSSTAPKNEQGEGGQGSSAKSNSTALAKRANGDVAHVGGVISPGAEFLRSQRTWQGLGSDFDVVPEDGTGNANAAQMEEGRRGIARGYVVGENGSTH
ncbi:putative diphthamide biosynthesis protein Dph2 [Westerdykella ornata]|uniref:2-(3-amino-3-carboxypropyl)histidine synthase subunit 2 n=1 Tax=Westerdykella ornata TaxID=318751 RepID=A0A6A6JL63_WESOR|nr:putative diphthamide biosynthesis protein Dph2 [Westerdykella ornata]KAF2276688.1 putative diphthamide biosynthesis protein Dph2 [Westerdykella ornata]